MSKISTHRSSLLDEPADVRAEIGTLIWARGVANRIRFSAEQLDSDVSGLQEWIEIAAKHKAWLVLGYLSLDSFLIAEANFTPSLLDAIRQARAGTTVGDAVAKARDNPLPTDDQKEHPRNPDGVNQYKQGERSGRNSTRPDDRSNTYTLRRLARDAPELLDKIEAGEMNVNQAAIAAGIRKKLSNAEKAVAAFKRSENRLEPLKLMVELLEPHELAVLRDWCIERLD